MRRLLLVALLLSPCLAEGAKCTDPETGRFVKCPKVEKVKREETFCFSDEGTPEECGRLRLRAYLGPMTAASTDIKPKVQPSFALFVETALTRWKKLSPAMNVNLALVALPDEDLQLQNPSSYSAFDGNVTLVQPLPLGLRFSLYGRAGVASRLVYDAEPSKRLPGYFEAGITFRSDDREHWLDLGFGPDQRLSGLWAQCIKVVGGVKLHDLSDRFKAWLTGAFIRAIATSTGPTPARDWYTFAFVVGL